MSQFLKCDAPNCDHHEDVPEITAEMVGKECPKCGANLLTETDWNMYSTVMKPAMDMMEALGISRPFVEGDPEHLKLRVHGHNGNLTMGFPHNPEKEE